jgi:hypothetical protein
MTNQACVYDIVTWCEQRHIVSAVMPQQQALLLTPLRAGGDILRTVATRS